jgi:hypothetical protein
MTGLSLARADLAQAAYPLATVQRSLTIDVFHNGGYAEVPASGGGRGIYLAAGTYYWSMDLIRTSNGDDVAHFDRTLYLAEDTYLWRCIITDGPDTVPGTFRYWFYVVCGIASSNHYPAYLPDGGDAKIDLYEGSGNYSWSSHLQHL